MKFQWIFAFWLLASPLLSLAASTDVVPNGNTEISVAEGIVVIQVNITTHQIDGQSTGTDDKSVLLKDCVADIQPCSLVVDIGIRINDGQLFIPRSAFTGLENVHKAQLIVRPKTFRLVLSGGDASESYIATIFFNKGRVLKRQIISPITPKDVLEKTIYRRQTESMDR